VSVCVLGISPVAVKLEELGPISGKQQRVTAGREASVVGVLTEIRGGALQRVRHYVATFCVAS
jgi:hypothetical protein